MRIILSAIDGLLADAWETCCGEFDLVEIHRGNILNLRVDAVVSPAKTSVPDVIIYFVDWLNHENQLKQRVD